MSDSFITKRPLRGRFAPSPTGRMHAGNIFAALMTWLMVRKTEGSIVLRVEDLDKSRSRQEYIDLVQRDFEALGLTWDEGPYYQHDRDDAYLEAFKALQAKELIYPCFCTRADLKAASAPHAQDKWVYTGTCRNLSPQQMAEENFKCKKEGRPGPSSRLKVPTGLNVCIHDYLQGSYTQDLASECGDFIVRRSDGDFAYQLAVVVDDAAQGINFVSRGIDLLPSSPQQAYLQDLLGLQHVEYAHFPLLCADDGRRLAKRDRDACIEQMLESGMTPQTIIGHIAFVSGLIDSDTPITCEELLSEFSFDKARAISKDNALILYS